MKVPTKVVRVIDHQKAADSIREARKRSGMTQRELARRLGFSACYVSDLEKGRRNWTEDNFRKALEIVSE